MVGESWKSADALSGLLILLTSNLQKFANNNSASGFFIILWWENPRNQQMPLAVCSFCSRAICKSLQKIIVCEAFSLFYGGRKLEISQFAKQMHNKMSLAFANKYYYIFYFICFCKTRCLITGGFDNQKTRPVKGYT